jgi:protein-S-isoprenylcysteine O-methyltransferase Ste14
MNPASELRRVPPLAWLAAGLLTQKLLPSRRRPSPTSLGLAGVISSASLGLLVWAVTAFRRHETTVDPLAPERASRLVADGPFRVTRNPMYVAMAGILMANACARRSVVGFLPAAGFVLVINKAQIEAEERAMTANFGADWERYVATTPRWLSLRSSVRSKQVA